MTTTKKVVKKSKKVVNKSDTWVVAAPKKSEVPYMPPLAASPEYITREAFHAQVIDMSEAMDNRFGAINSKFEERTQYQGWMVSPVLWKRCIATLGHAVLAYVAIGVVVVAFLMLIGA